MSSRPLKLSSHLFRLLLLVYAANFLKLVRDRMLEALDYEISLATLTLDLAHAVRQVRDVCIAALGTQLVERLLQAQQVVAVEPAGALADVNVLGEGLRVLRSCELVVVGRPDVHEGANGRRPVGRVERREVNCIPVDLPDVEVLFYLGHPVRADPVRRAPYLLRCRVVRVDQRGPERTLDERDDAAGRLRGAAVVLAALRFLGLEPVGTDR